METQPCSLARHRRSETICAATDPEPNATARSDWSPRPKSWSCLLGGPVAPSWTQLVEDCFGS